MHDLTAIQWNMLYLIAGLDGPHGLAIKDELDEYYDGEVHHPRLYTILDILVGMGLGREGATVLR